VRFAESRPIVSAVPHIQAGCGPTGAVPRIGALEDLAVQIAATHAGLDVLERVLCRVLRPEAPAADGMPAPACGNTPRSPESFHARDLVAGANAAVNRLSQILERIDI
jgi:hypothetical protein